jgi:hypothetical protein
MRKQKSQKPNGHWATARRSSVLMRSFWTALWCGGCLLAAVAAQAQAPTNQLHFAFTDPTGTTTVISDTNLNPGALQATLTMYNPAGTTAVDLHGAVGTGVTNLTAVDTNRAMDFTSDVTPTQVDQPAGNTTGKTEGNAVVAVDVGDTTLGANLGVGGVISNFVISMWFNQAAMMPSGDETGPRLWILNATSGSAGGVDSGGSANSLGLKFQANNQLYFQFGTDTATLGPALGSPFPTNEWLFVAITYDGTNASMYYGTASASAQVLATASSPGRSINLGGSATLSIGNRHSSTANQRGFDGWINDFRIYSGGVPTAALVESIRTSAVGSSLVISGVYPDGSSLMQDTNTLTFNVSSSSSTITNVDVVLNGIDVSSRLVTSGSATNLSVSYTGLTPNVPVNTAVITAWADGFTNAVTTTFDTFSATNFIVEAEEFDFNGGQFIDNPDYTDGNPPDTNSYYGLDSVEGIDTHKSKNSGTATGCYRAGQGDGTRTQTGVASGEQSWPKFANLVDASGNAIVGHIVGDWAAGEWQNYTKTFPAGKYNVYARVSASGNAIITLAQVISGQGTTSQTTTNLGTFTFTDTTYSLYMYAPLIDSLGNLAVVNLSGVNTVRATTSGDANADFYMFVPANTNLPVVSNAYPDGQYLFEPTNRLVFTVSSPVTTIATSNIQLTLNGTNVSSQLAFSGGPSTWNVSYPGLQENQTYSMKISVVDNLGNPIHDSTTIDTWNPVLQVEAEDFDFSSGQFIDNPVPTTGAESDSYYDMVGSMGVDEFNQNAAPPYAGASAYNYRPYDPVATPPVMDTTRRQFVNGALDYFVGDLNHNYWQNYTRTWPAGTYNIYGRMASGANNGNYHETWQTVIAGWGTTSQLTRNVGTFTIPTTNGYSAYMYVPLIDQFGNYAQVTMGGTNTYRALELTDSGTSGLNINFYMLVNPRTDRPRIDNVYPDGSTLQQGIGALTFSASSPTYGLNTTNIQVVLNGTNVSSLLTFTGSSTNWSVSYPELIPNQSYTAVITITDADGQVHSTTVAFDTFSATNFTWEAEDWDFDPNNSPVSNGTGLRFIDNPVPTSEPATNSYLWQVGDWDIDESSLFGTVVGTYVYRPSDLVSTEVTSDTLRAKYLNAQLQSDDPGIHDYDVDYYVNGGWINYTRTFPAGQYYVYARLSAGHGAFNLTCSEVKGGAGTTGQTVQQLGNFIGTGNSFNTWQYVPMINTNTGFIEQVTLNGVETLQMTGDNNENANFYMLVPVPQENLTAALDGDNIILSFPAAVGFNYSVQYKNNLSDPAWTQLGSTVAGNGTTCAVSDPATKGHRFYRLNYQ